MPSGTRGAQETAPTATDATAKIRTDRAGLPEKRWWNVMSERAYDVYRWEDEPDLDELRRLGDMLATDPARALSGLKELAGRGSIMSMVYLADAYRRGTGTEIDLLQSR